MDTEKVNWALLFLEPQLKRMARFVSQTNASEIGEELSKLNIIAKALGKADIPVDLRKQMGVWENIEDEGLAKLTADTLASLEKRQQKAEDRWAAMQIILDHVNALKAGAGRVDSD